MSTSRDEGIRFGRTDQPVNQNYVFDSQRLWSDARLFEVWDLLHEAFYCFLREVMQPTMDQSA